jgi:hypothetical protein
MWANFTCRTSKHPANFVPAFTDMAYTGMVILPCKMRDKIGNAWSRWPFEGNRDPAAWGWQPRFRKARLAVMSLANDQNANAYCLGQHGASMMPRFRLLGIHFSKMHPSPRLR